MENGYNFSDIQKLHCSYAESLYKRHMSEQTSTRKYTQPDALQDRHEEAVQLSLQIISEVQPLTKELKEQIKKTLEEVYHTYQKINQEKFSESPAIAIDFGTSNSRVAVYANGKVVVIPNSNDQKEIPSYVAIDKNLDTKSADIYVGERARRNWEKFPRSTIFGMKAWLTKQWSRDFFKSKETTFDVLVDNGNVGVSVERFYSVEELIRIIIQNLKFYAEEYLGISVSFAVMTVPVNFNSRQRELLKRAGTLAGLNVLQIVNEPTAALIGYELVPLKTFEASKTKYFLVFDCSARKLHITVFKCKGAKLEIIGFHEEFKGGDTFDDEMIKYCLAEFHRKHCIPCKSDKTYKKEAKRFRQLKLECERQKRILSTASSTTVKVSSFKEDIDLVIPFSRRRFEKLSREHFYELVEKVGDVLEKCGLYRDRISEVILIGGSSCIVGIQEVMKKYFQRDILCREINPTEAVVHGAALLAHGIKTNPEILNVEFQEMEITEPRSRLSSVLYDPSTPAVITENRRSQTEPPDFKPHQQMNPGK